MFGLLIISIAIGTLIWSFNDPTSGSMAFILVVILCIQGYLYLALNLGNLNKIRASEPPYSFSNDEAEVVRKYPMYFQFPYAAREFSSALSGIQLVSLIFVPWLLYKQLWIYSLIIGVNIILSGLLAKSYNPIIFLKAKTESPDSLASFLAKAELLDIESAHSKVVNKTKPLKSKN